MSIGFCWQHGQYNDDACPQCKELNSPSRVSDASILRNSKDAYVKDPYKSVSDFLKGKTIEKPNIEVGARFKYVVTSDIYIYQGSTTCLFGGIIHVLVIFIQEGKSDLRFMTTENFFKNFKQVKDEYEYQYLIMNKSTNEIKQTLAFSAAFETEEYAENRFKHECMESCLDWREYSLIKIEETKRLRRV